MSRCQGFCHDLIPRLRTVPTIDLKKKRKIPPRPAYKIPADTNPQAPPAASSRPGSQPTPGGSHRPIATSQSPRSVSQQPLAPTLSRRGSQQPPSTQDRVPSRFISAPTRSSHPRTVAPTRASSASPRNAPVASSRPLSAMDLSRRSIGRKLYHRINLSLTCFPSDSERVWQATGGTRCKRCRDGGTTRRYVPYYSRGLYLHAVFSGQESEGNLIPEEQNKTQVSSDEEIIDQNEDQDLLPYENNPKAARKAAEALVRGVSRFWASQCTLTGMHV